MGRCYFAVVALTWWLVMQCCTDLVEMPRHCKVRRPYAICTQYILHETQMINIIQHSIASDMLWIRNVRHWYAVKTLHSPQVSDRYTYCVAVGYLAIKLQSCYVHAALLWFLRRTSDVCMANRSCYEHV